MKNKGVKQAKLQNWHSMGLVEIGMMGSKNRITNIQSPHLLLRIYQEGRLQL